jgi:hypothetical protein
MKLESTAPYTDHEKTVIRLTGYTMQLEEAVNDAEWEGNKPLAEELDAFTNKIRQTLGRPQHRQAARNSQLIAVNRSCFFVISIPAAASAGVVTRVLGGTPAFSRWQ